MDVGSVTVFGVGLVGGNSGEEETFTVVAKKETASKYYVLANRTDNVNITLVIKMDNMIINGQIKMGHIGLVARMSVSGYRG